jgi:single-strand DNA-binding protein
MAGSVNKVILVGNLGKDPEARAMQNGGKVVSFSLATSESWNDKASGERRDKTQWHRVVIFNEKLGEIAEKYLKKGSNVYVEGSLESRKYTDNAGVEKEITEVVLSRFRGELTLLGSRAGEGGGGGSFGGDSGGYAPRQQPAARNTRPGGGGGAPSWEPPGNSDLDDEIPF